MIKINLLNSVTDRVYGVQSETVSIEKKIVNPQSQMAIVAVAVFAIMALVMVFDYWMTNSNYAKAETELAEQQKVALEMQAIQKEQAELEAQTKAIEARIVAIRTLRSNQQGPVAVLSAVNERIPPIINFRLDSIEQKAGEITISGDSPNESAVTQFGRSLEFSNGLFSNVSIAIERKAMTATGGTTTPTNYVAPETVSFKITTRYTPPSQLGAPQIAATPNGAALNAATPVTVTTSATMPAPPAPVQSN